MNSPMDKSWQLLLAACLAILMSITRSNYFDWAALLPSAPLAIFFLVGFYLIWRCARLADERYVRVERYYLTYLTDPLIYLAVAALVHTALNSIAHRSSSTDLETVE